MNKVKAILAIVVLMGSLAVFEAASDKDCIDLYVDYGNLEKSTFNECIKSLTGEINGLSYAIELSKKIEEIKWIKLKENHRSDLVGKILEYEYGK